MKKTTIALSIFASVIATQSQAVDGLEFKINASWVSASEHFTAGSKKLPLCARYNNYFCIKKPAGDTWNGQVGIDNKKHAIFSDPVMGTRAFFRLMRTYRFKYNLRSTNDIFGRYAPADDCIGSVDRDPVTNECPNGENPTWAYAKIVARKLGLKPTDDIKLFTGPNTVDLNVARTLAQGVAAFELSNRYRLSNDLIDKGIEKAGFSF